MAAGFFILLQGLLVGLVAIVAFAMALQHEPNNIHRARAITFLCCCLC